ncbi:MAG: hypothetical protein NDF54_10315 [archaeon GB-1867-035]|nr:hypothetical protein [Candidatus Culexmicrobium profundum]
MYENEQIQVEKSVLVDMLLASVQKLESRIRKKYYDYYQYYREIELPECYQSYPYVRDEAKQLLQVVYNLLERLEVYLQSKNTYQYYERYFEEYHSLFNELCEYFQIDIDEFQGYENFKQLLSKQELKEFEKVERVAELVNRPELVEQYLQKVKWSRLSLEEKLSRLINKWWSEKKKREKLSKELTYGGRTVQEWFEVLNLNEFQREYAKRHPWLLVSESGRSLLKKLEPHMVEGESNGN